MSEKFRYRAKENGYLGDREGYGFVKEGEVVTLSQPIKASWLTPLEQAPHAVRKEFNLPKVTTSPVYAKAGSFPAIHDPNMQAQMQTIREIEARQDGIELIKTNQPKQPEPGPAPEPAALSQLETPSVLPAQGAGEGGETQPGGDAQNGTGNQEVL